MITPASLPTMPPDEVVKRAAALAGDAFAGGRVDRGDPIIEVDAQAVAGLGGALRDDGALRFEQLVDVTAVHWPLDTGREFEVVHQFRSISHNLFLRVKSRVTEGASLPSLASEFASAIWLEREVFDLFGIGFDGHPDLRRILLPEGYEGHPLRKDYPVEGPNFPEDAHRNDLFGRLDPDDFWSEGKD